MQEAEGVPVDRRLLARHLRYGARGLLRQPAFTLVAVLTLALGIGANTALFSVINAVLLRPLPFPDPERVVRLFETFQPSGESSVSVPNLRDWRQQSTAFEGIAAYEDGAFNLELGGGAQRLRGLQVEANYFDVLGVRARLGRTFLKGEDEAGSDTVVALSDSLWREGFGSDPAVVDKTITLNGQKYTVVGVMPPALSSITRAQVWTPLVFPEGEETARGAHDYYAVGRIKRGVPPGQAREQLNVIAARLEQQYPDTQAGRGAGFREYREELVGDVRRPLLMLMGAVLFVLLIGAGLLVKSFARLRSVDSGLKPENVLTARLSLAEERYRDAETARRFYRQVLERVSALPGVEAAGVTSHLSVEEYGTNGFVQVEGKTYPPNGEPLVELRVVSPEYFRAVGVRLVRGRLFDERDAKDSAPGVVVNETMARAVWPGEDPVGKRVSGRPLWPGFVPVVGVVSDVKNMGLSRPTTPEFYFDYTRANEGMLRNMTLAVRSRLDAAALAAVVRREVQTADPGQPVYDVRTMQSVLDDTVSDRRLNMMLLVVLAALSLTLAVIGIYGVISYNVTRHTRDIGIRLALGAQTTDIHKLVIGRGAALALAGVLIGLAAALGLTRMMSGLLFDVSATDPATFGAIAALLFAAALVACYVPARRAVKVDPLIALRYE